MMSPTSADLTNARSKVKLLVVEITARGLGLATPRIPSARFPIAEVNEKRYPLKENDKYVTYPVRSTA